MHLTGTETVIMIFSIAAGTIITRFLPFVMFPEKRRTPPVVDYLGKALPPAMMGLLVVYCLRNIDISSGNHGMPEFLSIVLIILLHQWKSNVLLSIGGGTIFYMFLLRYLSA